MDLRPRSSSPVPPDRGVQRRTRRARKALGRRRLGHARPNSAGAAILSIKDANGARCEGSLDCRPRARSRDHASVRSTLDAALIGHALWFDVTIRDRRSPTRRRSAERLAASRRCADSSMDLSALVLSWRPAGFFRFVPRLGGAATTATATSPRRRSTRRPSRSTPATAEARDKTRPPGYEDPSFTQPVSDRAYAFLPVQGGPLSVTPIPNNPTPLATPDVGGTSCNLGPPPTWCAPPVSAGSIDVGRGGAGHAVDRTGITDRNSPPRLDSPASLAVLDRPLGLQTTRT